MMITNQPTIPSNNKKSGCTQTYTFAQVYQIITDLYAAKKSFRRIAREDFRGLVNHATIQRIAAGHEPKRADIRYVLGLSVSKEIIPLAGDIPNGTQVHHATRCTCGQYFISNHPRRTRCFQCSPYRGKK